MRTVRKYGAAPFSTVLLHGGPGASGEMRPVAIHLSRFFGVLELLQTERSIEGQISEIHDQLLSVNDLPVTLIGHSWGAWLGFLFAGRYADLVKKLVLISAGAFESHYNKEQMQTRLNRLNPPDRIEAERLIQMLKTGLVTNKILESLGNLMAKADSFDKEPDKDEKVEIDAQIYQPVWAEASRLRDTNELVACASSIKCPVVAIHGDYDTHPAEGVEKPLSARLNDFRMILVERCGHFPWREKSARYTFYEMLKKEISLNTP